MPRVKLRLEAFNESLPRVAWMKLYMVQLGDTKRESLSCGVRVSMKRVAHVGRLGLAHMGGRGDNPLLLPMRTKGTVFRGVLVS
uniref:Uncharacterized protein n=1 Tax=Cannabis sativa TaxID=3483 RepID=A0A803QHT3_CANSA